MEFKDHVGPVYALHRVFTLNDVDWPQVDVRLDEADENRDGPPTASSMTVPVC
jgi:hypothetical protein